MPRFIDLSQPIHDGLITYPGLPAPKITPHMSFEASHTHYASGTEFQIARIEMVANTGTYLDAPSHRFRGKGDVAALPLEKLADLPGIVIDATRCGRSIRAKDLGDANFSGCAVLIRTGWSKHFGKPEYGQGHPFLTEDSAQLLVSRRATLVGIDSLNIDDMADGRRPVHTALLDAGIPIVEHMRGLEDLPSSSFRFFAIPAPVQGFGSFPVRAFAIAAER